MGFPGPSPEEIEAQKKRDKISDARITAAKLELERRKAEARSIPLYRLIPKPAKKWINNRLTPATEAVQEAQIEYEWAIYDKGALKRPLYPRKRAISPSNKAFRKGQQEYCSQEQSNFFKLLPPEIRVEIYRKVFGKLIIEIDTSHAGFNGPPPSSDHTIFWQSKIDDADGGGRWTSLRHIEKPITFNPHIVSLLQVCRQIYAESIVILYSESIFKTHTYHNVIGWTKFLLKERLQVIRSVHFQLNLGYPWGAPNICISLEAIASLKSLQKLCIVGRADGMVDSKHQDLIDAELWKNRKHILLPLFLKFAFIRHVDIFLPIMHSILTRENESIIRGSRLHGLSEEQSGKHPRVCACSYKPEILAI
ncbi:hypothetical protein BGW36DRAFT_390840 [Talaromyces proteolyticus]|uniref:DUF7730 domain-containing protein n=1 Tax=Talaromyces proteolyticus TaxID=1131652 RepID=A0AAD4KDB2_9EURO|nr:uncharacterized protein BGW36DRAFT_390840 [Talaromyces proteolyticus]KAH8689421.1 hypothetical protein BGW36DRAFT_390840 [Talaromyces proteolyticus]